MVRKCSWLILALNPFHGEVDLVHVIRDSNVNSNSSDVMECWVITFKFLCNIICDRNAFMYKCACQILAVNPLLPSINAFTFMGFVLKTKQILKIRAKHTFFDGQCAEAMYWNKCVSDFGTKSPISVLFLVFHSFMGGYPFSRGWYKRGPPPRSKYLEI